MQGLRLILLLLITPSLLKADGKVDIISSFSIPDDWARALVSFQVSHRSLIGPKSEFHGYTITTQDARDLQAAVLIVGCSKLMEPQLYEWVTKNHREANTIWLEEAEGIPPLPHSHAWTNPVWVRLMVIKLNQSLAVKFPNLNTQVSINKLLKEVDDTDSRLMAWFSSVPEARRAIITQHPNLEPFAERYHLRLIDTILSSPSAEAADPSAQKYRQLLQEVRQSSVRVVVVDEGQNDSIAQNLCRDANLAPPLSLSFEYLQPVGQPGSTWAEMMLHEGQLLKDALLAP
jgi:zinc/manganese transport system substrate-binding protein